MQTKIMCQVVRASDSAVPARNDPAVVLLLLTDQSSDGKTCNAREVLQPSNPPNSVLLITS